MKKLFVVSDIHGHYTLLKEALDKSGFEIDNPNHKLICLGDYFDRGSENKLVLKFFERLKNKVLLMGNHEELLLKLFQTGKVLPHNYINGTIQTLQEFFGKYCIDPTDDSLDFSGRTSEVNRICEFIDETIDYYETDDYVFVHGYLPQTDYKTATKEDWQKARWTRWSDVYTGERPLKDKTLVCGHMPVFFAKKFDETRKINCPDIFYGNGIIAIDAGTYDSQQINVLVIENKHKEV
mgnify:CR=1 FL=1